VGLGMSIGVLLLEEHAVVVQVLEVGQGDRGEAQTAIKGAYRWVLADVHGPRVLENETVGSGWTGQRVQGS
jgi:hypothetical protein